MLTSRFSWLVLIGALLVVFNILFWDESLGINLPIFTTLLTFFSLQRNKPERIGVDLQMALACQLVTGVSVVWFNGTFAIFLHLISFLLSCGLLFNPSLRIVHDALATSFQNLGMAFHWMGKKRMTVMNDVKPLRKLNRDFKLIIIPLLIAIVFFVLYASASDSFSKLFGNAWEYIYTFFSHIFDYISFGRIVFTLLGLWLIVSFTCKTFKIDIKPYPSEILERVRKKSNYNQISPTGMIALMNEHRSGFFLLVLLNIMILMVNALEIPSWFHFEMPKAYDLKYYVHQGTIILIISILLCMAVVLYMFRGNINFFKGNKLLKQLALLWLAQNAILAIGIWMRNYQYIQYHGLAYRRIGVVIFLVLVFIGLMSLFVKVMHKKNIPYLLRVNSWAAIIVLTVSTMINWDSHIVEYNLNHPNGGEIDVDFYLKLSPKVYPYLYKNIDLVEKQIAAHQNNYPNWIAYKNISEFKEDLDRKSKYYIYAANRRGWPSWTYTDENTLLELKEIK
jgi:hypothetical protein